MTAHHQTMPIDTLSRTVHELASETNRNRWGRLVSVALGGAVMMVGLRRRSLVGTAMTLIGGWLCYRGISGRTLISELFATSATADATEIERSITIEESADELYQLWRDPQQLAHIVGHFAEVTSVGEDYQQWVVPLPVGRLAWDARIVEKRPGEFLRWESLAGAILPNEGTVHFHSAPDHRTEVTLQIRFDPPGGVLGDRAVERLDTGPRLLAGTALRRFKSLAETGEIPTLEHNPSAHGSDSGDTV